MYEYTWYQWLLFFFLYCFIGWIIESTYVSVKSLRIVNRGFLRLPLLPLYGTGAILMLVLSIPIKGHVILVFLSGMIGATLLEYLTGYLMERLFKMKYWDYSNNPWNLNGYICLSTSIAWGALTILLTEVVHRPLEYLVLQLSIPVNITIVAVTGLLFLLDTIHSTKEALDLGKVLEAMTKIKVELEELQVQMSLLKSETALKVTELRNETINKATTVKEERLRSLMDSKEKLANRLSFYRKGILKRNPSASSRLFGEALHEIMEYSKKYRKNK